MTDSGPPGRTWGVKSLLRAAAGGLWLLWDVVRDAVTVIGALAAGAALGVLCAYFILRLMIAYVF